MQKRWSGVAMLSDISHSAVSFTKQQVQYQAILIARSAFNVVVHEWLTKAISSGKGISSKTLEDQWNELVL
jgi:hypothetical protein